METRLWVLEKGEVVTTSRMRVWWLTHVCGYQVHSESDEPRQNVLGKVRLVRRWSLGMPPS
jgi:hypothetical protein